MENRKKMIFYAMCLVIPSVAVGYLLGTETVIQEMIKSTRDKITDMICSTVTILKDCDITILLDVIIAIGSLATACAFLVTCKMYKRAREDAKANKDRLDKMVVIENLQFLKREVDDGAGTRLAAQKIIRELGVFKVTLNDTPSIIIPNTNRESYNVLAGIINELNPIQKMELGKISDDTYIFGRLDVVGSKDQFLLWADEYINEMDAVIKKSAGKYEKCSAKYVETWRKYDELTKASVTDMNKK